MKQHPNQIHAMNWRRRAIAAGLMMVALLFGAQSVLAATVTWTGADVNNANWNTAANWSTNAVPVAGDDLVFPQGAARHVNVNNLNAGTSFHSISITGLASGYNITGNAIELVAGLSADNGGGNSVYLDVTLTAAQQFTVTGDRLRLYGAIDLGANTLTLVGATGVVGLNGVVSGTGGITSSAHIVYVNANATYSGPTTITGGAFTVSGSSLDPASLVTVNGGYLQIVNNGSVGPVTVNTPSVLYLAGGANNTGNLTDLTMQAGSTLQMGMDTPANHGTINASGAVDLGGATLNGSWSFSTATGDAFTLINKTSPGAITGTFNGLAEGATFTANSRTYRISYVGGTGNDVVITDVTPPAVAAPIPTLSEWALIGLSMMLAGVAFLGLRRQR